MFILKLKLYDYYLSFIDSENLTALQMIKSLHTKAKKAIIYVETH